ncbi:MAG: hypothetical protein D6E12_07320 [Desulfovibrio sp.]|nr:MAG: hypothetical protein D6E12_07320 [Desulfovibrio sp.]
MFAVGRLIRCCVVIAALLCIAAMPCPAQDYSMMNGAYQGEFGGQATLTYDGEGTVSLHVEQGDLFFDGFGALQGEHLIAAYNHNTEVVFFVFYSQDLIILSPSNSAAAPLDYPIAFTRIGSPLSPDMESLWLEPMGEYTNSEGSLSLVYEGEGSVILDLDAPGCAFGAYGGTDAGRTVQVYNDDGLRIMTVFYDQNLAVAVPLVSGLCEGLTDYVFRKGNAASQDDSGSGSTLAGFYDQHRTAQDRTYMNELGRITLGAPAEGQAQAEIVTENCDFTNIAYFYPPGVATVIHYQTHEPLAVFFYTDTYAIARAIHPDFCNNGMDFWDPFYADNAPAEQFMEPGGTFQDQNGNTLHLTYFGEGIVEMTLNAQSCSFTSEAQTFISHGIGIYDDHNNLLALAFYENDYAVLKAVDPDFCGASMDWENRYERIK